MRRPAPSLVLPALAAVLATGCGVTPTGPVAAGEPASGVRLPGTEARTARLYFAGPYGIRSVSRPTDRPLTAQQAVDLLLEGPTPAERERGLISRVPPLPGQLSATSTARGTVDLYVPLQIAETGSLDAAALGQLVCTVSHADLPGDAPAADVVVSVHENMSRSAEPFRVRCGPNNYAEPADKPRATDPPAQQSAPP